MNKIIYLFLAVAISVTACKKDPDPIIDNVISNAPATGTRDQLTLDSIYYFAKEIYLWNSSLPEYETFNPRSFGSRSSGVTAFESALYKISQYPVNPVTGKPYEYYAENPGYPKYSYIDDNSNGRISGLRDDMSSVGLDGTGHDFGFALSAVTADDIRIRYVNPGSPADSKGLQRGDQVLSINGRAINNGSSSGTSAINNAMNASSISMSIRKADGSTATVSLNQSTYTSNPVLKTSVIDRGNVKIGYLALARFSSSGNARTHLIKAFNDFATAGVSNLVIDLRYNGGGYVSTAEFLVNLIAPSSLNSKLMYTEHFNSTMQNGRAVVLKNVPLLDDNGKVTPYTAGANGKYATYFDLDYSVSGNTFKFAKEGRLDNVAKVCFIVGPGTASASELTINALKPYMNVKLVGKQTYGKPVGFFGIDIDRYTVYMSNFVSKNANNEGDYFNGFVPDIAATDDVTRDFGDPQEVSLSKAIAYLTSGNTLSANAKMTLKGGQTVSAAGVDPQSIESGGEFKGMVENRLRLKK